jgi:hypothetical protein
VYEKGRWEKLSSVPFLNNEVRLVIVLNKRNEAYIKGKRKSPKINLEAYDHLANQIEKASKSVTDYQHIFPVLKRFTLGEIGCWLLILLFGIIFLALSLETLRTMILYHLTDGSIDVVIFDLIAVIFTLIISLYFFRLIWLLCLSIRTRMKILNIRRLIKTGELVIGHVESVHVVEENKGKSKGRRKINIEYSFVIPYLYVEKGSETGVFTTSKVRAVASGDEVAVWYINPALHVLL